MKIDKIFLVLLAMIILWPNSFGQQPHHFYNVDKEMTIEGTIQEIFIEPRYKGSAPFVILLLEEKNTRKRYQAEISPTWFFDYDFHKGEKIKVTGSLYLEGEAQNIIARRLEFKGETLVLRDRRGFPSWSGGQMRQKGRRKGKGF